MENYNKTAIVYKIVENKPNLNGLQGACQLQADIQVSYLNMLHEQGMLPDNIYSIAINKAIKGVI